MKHLQANWSLTIYIKSIHSPWAEPQVWSIKNSALELPTRHRGTVGQLLEMFKSCVGMSRNEFHLRSSWDNANDGPGSWISTTHMKDSDGVSHSQLCPGPVLAITGRGGGVGRTLWSSREKIYQAFSSLPTAPAIHAEVSKLSSRCLSLPWPSPGFYWHLRSEEADGRTP